MWKSKDTCLSAPAKTDRQIFRQFKKLRSRNLHGGHRFSLALFMLCDKRFSKTSLKQKMGGPTLPRLSTFPSSSAHISSLLSLICPRRQSDEKLCSALLGVLPSVQFCAWEQSHGLTSRFPLLISPLHGLWKMVAVKVTVCPKGNTFSGSCTSLCGCLPFQMLSESLA